uniref:Zinc finger HIT domain-containing protein n=1 Tax=Amphiprion percula TaxID=161767 RepID=A0A3P8T9Z1_AMPPE
MQVCNVCSEQTPKYRCPAYTCLPVEKPPALNPEAKDAVSTGTWGIEVFFFSAGQSKELRDLLCNPHLRQLLRSIDSDDSKGDAMKAAMQEPLFEKSLTYNEDGYL